MASAKSNSRSGSKSRAGSSAKRASSRSSSASSKGRSASSSRSAKSTSSRSGARSSKTNPNTRSSSSRPGSPRARRAAGSSSGSRSRAGSQTTTDHDQIRQWAEARGAKPSCVRGTGGGGDTGMLRLDFPGYSGGDSLQEISWDEFFEKFDDQGLALLYQETTKGGQPSNFNKLVSRQTARANGRKAGGGAKGSRGGRSSK